MICLFGGGGGSGGGEKYALASRNKGWLVLGEEKNASFLGKKIPLEM